MKLKLWQQIIIALILGIIVGLILTNNSDSAIVGYLKSLGDFFFKLIKMLIVPLIFISLVVGMTSMGDTTKMGRVAGKTFFIYLLTTAIAIFVGMVIALVTNLGKDVDISGAYIPEKVQQAAEKNEALTFVDTILNLVPSNIINAMATNNILQVIVFAILFGLAITRIGEKAEPLKKVFTSASYAIYELTAIVMRFAPIGIFGVMAWAIASYGSKIIGALLMVVITCYIASIIHAAFTYSSLLAAARLNPLTFFKKVISPAVFAFVSTSSSGTLPISIATAREKMGVSESTASFVLPLGATINMDGTAIYQGVCAIFIANAFGVDLGASQYMMIVLLATLASIGTAGAPGAGLIMLSGLLVAVGLPLEGVGLIFAIDRILDMARTSVNVIGDNMVSILIAKSENELDLETFNNQAA